MYICVRVCVWVSECERNVIRMYIYIFFFAHNFTQLSIYSNYTKRDQEKKISLLTPFPGIGSNCYNHHVHLPSTWLLISPCPAKKTLAHPPNIIYLHCSIVFSQFAMCSPCFLHVSSVFLAEHPPAWPPLDRRCHKPGMPQSRPLPERSPSSARS